MIFRTKHEIVLYMSGDFALKNRASSSIGRVRHAKCRGSGIIPQLTLVYQN